MLTALSKCVGAGQICYKFFLIRISFSLVLVKVWHFRAAKLITPVRHSLLHPWRRRKNPRKKLSFSPSFTALWTVVEQQYEEIRAASSGFSHSRKTERSNGNVR